MILYIFKDRGLSLQYVTFADITNSQSTKVVRATNTLRQTVLKGRLSESAKIDVNYIGWLEFGSELQNVLVFIKNIVVDENDPLAVEITVAIGSDGIDEEVYLTTSTTQNNIIDTLGSSLTGIYWQYLNRPIQFVEDEPISGYIRNTDQYLPLGQCIRQLATQGVVERGSLSADGKNVVFNYTKPTREYVINTEDTIKTIITFAKDTYTAYILINAEDLTQRKYAVLRADGEIGITLTQLDTSLSFIPKVEIVEASKFTQEECNNALRAQSYKNSIELTILPNSYVFNGMLETNNIFSTIGTKLNVYLKSGELVRTTISEIELVNGVVKMVLGVSKTRFIDKLKGGDTNE